MAESDGKPASSPLSTEEADRLSEKFKPSWEAEQDPPTIPKVAPPKNFGKQTLLGIAAPMPDPRKAEAESKAPDDLDWELPTNPAPERAPEAPLIEPPPKSNPSGIGEKYIPKEIDAPPIVIKEEVKRAEEVALAQIDAEHKARRAPTVLKFKAIESPQKAAADELDPEAFVSPKRGLGVYVGLGAGAILVALIGIMVVVKSTTSEEPLPQPTEVKTAEPPPQAEPPPPPPPPVVAPAPAPPPEPKAPEPVVEPVSDPKALEPPKAAEPKPAAEPEPTPPKPVSTAPKPPAPKPTAAAPKPPKPVSTAPKPAPASKPASQKPAAGGIVRDAPF